MRTQQPPVQASSSPPPPTLEEDSPQKYESMCQPTYAASPARLEKRLTPQHSTVGPRTWVLAVGETVILMAPPFLSLLKHLPVMTQAEGGAAE